MKKLFMIVLALVLMAAVALIGCEKKAEAPKPAEMPAMAPAAPAPAAPAPATPAPAPAAPAKK